MNKPFIVAEMSCNHLGDFGRAVNIIIEAAKAGADAVKFQVFEPSEMTFDESYKIAEGLWEGRTLFDLYEEAYTPWDWLPDLYEVTRLHGMVPFASPFGGTAVDFLEKLETQMYKVASCELIDTPLIRRIAKTGKPIIMSTGMASHNEIRTAVDVAQTYGPRDITLLYCVSAYPAKPQDYHMDTMIDYHFRFNTKVGVSDHTLGSVVPVIAAAKDAAVIEKHLTLDRTDGGLDAAFSMEPHEFKRMVEDVRMAAKANGVKRDENQAESSTRALRRALYFAEDLPEGALITNAQLTTARPALGISPQEIDFVVGATTIRPVKRGEPVKWETINVRSVLSDRHTKQ